MDTLLQILVHGAVTSAVFALVALGFSLMYGVGGIVNLAHGSFFMIGAYIAVTASATFGFPVWGAVLTGVLAAGLAGIFVDRALIRPVRSQPVTVLIITLGAAIFVAALIRHLYGTADRNLPGLAGGKVVVLGVDLQSTRAVAFAVGVTAVTTLIVVLRRTPIGRVVRAVAEDREAATLMGIDPGKTLLWVSAVGAALAGLAGVMVAPSQVVAPDMWLAPLTQAFAIVIMGGLGSIEGTVFAAVLLGFLDRTVAFRLEERYAPLISILVILLVLALRPAGILRRSHT